MEQLAQAVVQQLAALLPCCVYTGVLLPGGQAIRYIPYIPLTTYPMFMLLLTSVALALAIAAQLYINLTLPAATQ
jgi:hypothetical protein